MLNLFKRGRTAKSSWLHILPLSDSIKAKMPVFDSIKAKMPVSDSTLYFSKTI